MASCASASPRARSLGVYTTVPRPQESWSSGPVEAIDSFTIELTPAS